MRRKYRRNDLQARKPEQGFANIMSRMILISVACLVVLCSCQSNGLQSILFHGNDIIQAHNTDRADFNRGGADQDRPNVSAEPATLPDPTPAARPDRSATPTRAVTALPTRSPALTVTVEPTRSATHGPMPSATPVPLPTIRPKKATPTPTRGPGKYDPVVIDGITYYNGFADPRSITPQPALHLGELTALVNKYYALEADDVPPLSTIPGTSHKLQPEACEAYLRMLEACRNETGIALQTLSAYRSYATQAYSFRNAIERKGIYWTVPYNALEGRSEHQLGLAVDVHDGQGDPYKLAFATTAAFQWLSEHAHEYGYILRYLPGKEAITGYAHEPWHYRYVGLEAAAVIKDNGCTLEEYWGIR